jgi:hypothetical protein
MSKVEWQLLLRILADGQPITSERRQEILAGIPVEDYILTLNPSGLRIVKPGLL